jgi:hypothetical protein
MDNSKKKWVKKAACFSYLLHLASGIIHDIGLIIDEVIKWVAMF